MITNLNETKEQLRKLGRLDEDLNVLIEECIKDLDQAKGYEKLFGNLPRSLIELEDGVAKNTRDIVTICIPCIKGNRMIITTSDLNVIKQKLSDNDRLLDSFQTLIRQIIKQ